MDFLVCRTRRHPGIQDIGQDLILALLKVVSNLNIRNLYIRSHLLNKKCHNVIHASKYIYI